MIDKKLQIFDSGRGYPRNGYGGPTEWAQNWAAVQRAAGKRPSWRDFIEAAKATGWPSVNVPGLGRDVHGPIPIEFLEWVFVAGGVYFIEIRGRVKIGYASNFAMRFKTLQSASPDKIHVHATLSPAEPAHERALHIAFAQYRLNGEWFEFAPPLRQFTDWAKVQFFDCGPPDPSVLKARAAQFITP